jgi:hypothetical protein
MNVMLDARMVAARVHRLRALTYKCASAAPLGLVCQLSFTPCGCDHDGAGIIKRRANALMYGS